ncbi:hypothetical protein J6590_020541 [Homalodisca vitripennis]|nr:hypothetical protein J6590_020541 [Homalodisca vitripennis]
MNVTQIRYNSSSRLQIVTVNRRFSDAVRRPPTPCVMVERHNLWCWVSLKLGTISRDIFLFRQTEARTDGQGHFQSVFSRPQVHERNIPTLSNIVMFDNLGRDLMSGTVAPLDRTSDEKRKSSLEIVPNFKLRSHKTEYEYVPPDGGWGWLVLLGSVLVSLLIPGTIKSFGVLFVEFLEVFNLSPAVASWIPALTYFLYCSLGPLASYLSTKYGYRIVTLLGGVFAASGVIASVFATHIAHLYIW